MSRSSEGDISLSGTLSGPVLASLDLYVELLMEWNRSIRLAGYRSPQEIFRHLVLEPVLASLYFRIGESDLPLIDFGSGNGSPGIIFALLNPGRPVCLVERKEKKRSFLNYLVGRFNLPAVRVSGDLKEALSGKDKDVHLWMKGISMASLREAVPSDVSSPSSVIHVFKFGELDQIGDCQDILLHVINSESFRVQPLILVQVTQCRWCIRKT